MFKKNNLKYLLLLVCGLLIIGILLPFYKGGKMISGWEGAYFLDFPLMLKNYGYSWYNSGAGMFATSLNFGYVFHLSLLQSLVHDVRITNFVMIFSLYFLPFCAIYLLSLNLGLKPLLAILVAAFYITNPFVANFMKSINQWNMLAAYILPSFFLIIFRFYFQPWRLFFIFGLNSLVFAFANANPPTMILYQVSIVLFVLIITLYKEKRIALLTMAKNYFVVMLSFLLFNFWWIINWFYIFSDAGRGYSKQVAISWLRGGGGFVPAFWRTFTLTSLLQFPVVPDYDYFAQHFSRFYAPLILLVPIIILAYFFFRKGLYKRVYLVLGLVLILIGFLAKGVNGVFGGVYEFMVMYVPLFNIFKSAEEKWGLLFTFFLALCLIFSLRALRKDKRYRFVIGLLLVYVLYCTTPFATGNFLPDYDYLGKIIGSKRYLDKPEYISFRQSLSQDPLQYRVLSFPGSNNYQVALHIEGKRFYTGNDPILNNTTKPFIGPFTGAPLQNFNSLYDAVSKPNYQNILGLFNIKKIAVNKDMYPWFGFREKMLVAQTEEFLDKKMTATKGQAIDVYDTQDYFLPRFYIPENIIFSPNASNKDLPLLAGAPEFRQRSAFLLGKTLDNVDQKILETIKEKSSVDVIIPEVRSTDEKKIREGNNMVNPSGVLFPYARWRPGSYFYKYVLEKEQKAKEAVKSEADLSFDSHLFYAAKRISEIQKWDINFSDQEFESILGRYQEEMQSAIDDLDKLITTEDDAYPFLQKIEVSFTAHEKRLLDILKGDFGLEDNQRLNLAKQVFEDIASQLEKIVQERFSISKYYSTTIKSRELNTSLLKNIATKKFIPLERYYFTVDEKDEYGLFAEKLSMPTGGKLAETDPENNTASSEFSPQESFAYWDFFGRLYLDQGRHYFSSIADRKNLLGKQFFGQEGPIDQDINGISMSVSTRPLSQKIDKWQSEKSYKISLKYKGDEGKLKVNLTEYSGENPDETWFRKGVEGQPSRANFVINETLDLDGSWTDFISESQPSFLRAESANLFLTKFSTTSAQPVEIKDLMLEEIYEPKIMLTKSLPNKFPLKMPKLSFQKINPTKYLVHVDEATSDYLLVFSESFHRGWKAYIDKFSIPGETVGSYFGGEIKEIKEASNLLDKNIIQTLGKKPIPEDRHILINGYANSWLISPQDAGNNSSYTIIIEYWPQRLFYIGAMVTILTVILACFVFFILRCKKT